MTLGRRGLGIELKPTYYRQALRNLETAVKDKPAEQRSLLEMVGEDA